MLRNRTGKSVFLMKRGIDTELRGRPPRGFRRCSKLYANMDLFVFPSRTDTFGNVVLEAFASGTPAVVTDAAGPDSSSAQTSAGSSRQGKPSVHSNGPPGLPRDTDLRTRMGHAARMQATRANPGTLSSTGFTRSTDRHSGRPRSHGPRDRIRTARPRGPLCLRTPRRNTCCPARGQLHDGCAHFSFRLSAMNGLRAEFLALFMPNAMCPARPTF